MVDIFYKTKNAILRFCDNAIPKSLYNNILVAGRIAQKRETLNEYLLRYLQFCAFAIFAMCAFALFRNLRFCAIYKIAMVSFCDIVILRYCDIAISGRKSQITMSQIHKITLFKENLSINQISVLRFNDWIK